MICDLINLPQFRARLNLTPPPVQCRSVRPDVNDLPHSSCEPVGVAVQNLDIVNADFVFRSISADVPRYLRVRTARSSVFEEASFQSLLRFSDVSCVCRLRNRTTSPVGVPLCLRLLLGIPLYRCDRLSVTLVSP